MKAWKYILIALLLAAVALAVVHFQRERLAMALANELLEDYGVVVVDVAIDHIGTAETRFRRLVVVTDGGAELDARAVVIRLALPDRRPSAVSIDEIDITPAEPDGTPPPLARLLADVLALPGRLPGTAVDVARLTVPGRPVVESIRWRPAAGGQTLLFELADISATVTAAPAPDDRHTVTMAASVGEAVDALVAELAIERRAGAIGVSGDVALSLEAWLPTLASLGLAPKAIVAATGRLAGPVTAIIDEDARQPVHLAARPAADGDLQLTLDRDDGAVVEARTLAAPTFDLGVEYPSLAWTLTASEVRARVGLAPLGDLDATLTGLSCRTGPRCEFEGTFAGAGLRYAGTAVAAARAEAAVTIEAGEPTSILVEPRAASLSGIDAGDWSISRARLESAAAIVLSPAPSGLRAASEGVGIALDGVRVGDRIGAELPLALTDLALDAPTAALSGRFAIAAGSGVLSWGSLAVPIPGVDGGFAIEAGRRTVDATLSAPGGATTGRIAVELDAAGAGRVRLRDAALRFDAGRLSTRVRDWPYEWDVIRGSIQANADAEWRGTGAAGAITATARLVASGVGGRYADVGFAGAEGTFDVRLDPAQGIRIAPATVRVGWLGVGLPIENVVAEIALADSVARVGGLSMTALGGTLRADDFDYDLASRKAAAPLHVDSIQLGFIVGLADFEALDVTGSVSGLLPIDVEGTAITIADGRLASDPPGGVIRYRTGAAAEDPSALGIVNRALANFEYDSLTSEVGYTREGDLVLKMRLTGVNPDMDARQPIVLNLGIENNVPQLLRSLQATRAIEEIIERRSRH